MIADFQRTGDHRKSPLRSVGKEPQKPRCRAPGCAVVDADVMRSCGMPKVGYERDGVNALLTQSGAGFAHGIGVDCHECNAVGLA